MSDQLLNTHKYQLLTYEQLKDLGDYALGLKLLIKCHEASYVGVCSYILSESKEVILEQVYVVSKEKQLFGLFFICYQDIVSIHVIGVNAKARKRLWKENHERSEVANRHLMKQILPPSLSLESLDELNIDELPELIQSQNLLPNFRHELIRPVKWAVVNSLEEEHFKLMLNDIKLEKAVSIFGCGVSLGRGGSLAWLACGVADLVYLVDVAKIGARELLLSSPAGAALSDEAIVKIVHNGRKLEDYLSHQHGISLTNVFDTQASDLYLYKYSESSSVPCLVKSLTSLMEQHLKFSKTEVRKLFPEIEDESMWMERPLHEALLIYLVHSVMFLKELREAMMKIILSDLQRLNDTFLSSIKNKPPSLSDGVEEQIVPRDVQDLMKRTRPSPATNINFVN